MAWYNENNPDNLNFIVAGNCHSGSELLQLSLSAHPEMVCHGDLLHPDEQIRQSEHEEYFGPSGKVPDWYLPKHLSAEQYLNNKIFDNALHEEVAIGVRIGYAMFSKYDLWEYADLQCRKGSFCVLHVTRNPVACFVEQCRRAPPPGDLPFPITQAENPDRVIELDPVELTDFVREHLSDELKIDRLCSDRAVIPYHEMVLDFTGTMQQLSEFMGIRYSPACIPNRKAIQLRDMWEFIGNWDELKAELPLDVLGQLENSVLL